MVWIAFVMNILFFAQIHSSNWSERKKCGDGKNTPKITRSMNEKNRLCVNKNQTERKNGYRRNPIQMQCPSRHNDSAQKCNQSNNFCWFSFLFRPVSLVKTLFLLSFFCFFPFTLSVLCSQSKFAFANCSITMAKNQIQCKVDVRIP